MRVPRIVARAVERASVAIGSFEFARVRAGSLASNVRALLLDIVAAGATEDDESEQEQLDAVELVQPLGLFARPKPSSARTSTLEALVTRDGDEAIAIAVIDKGLTKLADGDIAQGETSLHGAATENVACRVVIRINGDVCVYVGSGRALRVNDGTVPVAHEGSATSGHTHGITGLSVVVPPGGAGGTFPVVGTMDIATDTIAPGEGTTQLKVNDT